MHLSLEAIIDLLDGRSEDKHTEQCAECRGRVEEWQLLHSRLHTSHLEDAPLAVLRAAYGIMESRPSAVQVLAFRIFDSFTQPAFAGARGADDSRQLVLRAAEFDIHVRISGKSEKRQITGQIMTRTESGFIDLARVHLLHNGEPIQTSELGSLGEFEFENTPAGLLSLQIDLPNLTVIAALGNEKSPDRV
jgi:hypothetical protein